MTPLLLCALTSALAATPLLSWDLDADDGAFVTSGTSGQWEWGTPETGPKGGYTGNAVWATGLTRPYLNDSTDYLALPAADLSGASRPVLHFYHWFEIDTGGDAAWVEAWDGDTWERLDPIYGYPADAGYTGVSNDWEQVWIDLSGLSYTSELRFAFSTNDAVQLAGWFIDDLTVLDGDPVPPRITVLQAPVDTQVLDGSYAIRTQILEDAGSLDARLVWWNDEGTQHTVSMSAEGDDVYTAEIPAAAPDTWLYWVVQASDSENTSSAPEEDSYSFRVYLAAPRDLSGPDGRLVSDVVTLSWTAPDSPHEVLSYRIYRDGIWVADASAPTATVPLAGPRQSFHVTAVYAAGEGDPSDQLLVDASIPVVQSLDPQQAWQGDQVYVDVVGASLLLTDADAGLDLGEDIAVLDASVVDANRARFTLEISEDAETGPRQGSLTSGDNRITLPSPFTVLSGEDRPRLVHLTPDVVEQGETVGLTLEANADFADVPELDLGDGLYIEEISWDDDRVSVRATAAWDAPVGAREVYADDGARVLDGVTLTVRNALTTPQRTCATAPGTASLSLLVAALAAWCRRAGRPRRRARSGR